MLEPVSLVTHLMVEAEDTSLSLNWVDGILVLFFAYGFMSAHRLGFVGELPRAAGWVAALVFGVRWYPYAATQIEEHLGVGPELAAFYGFLLIGVFFLSVAYVIGMTISRFRTKAVEGGLDLWGGILFGPCKMVAAYFWLLVVLLLIPSVWLRKNLGAKTFTGNLVMKYVPDIAAKVEESMNVKDSLEKFIEQKRRPPPEEAFEQLDEEAPVSEPEGETEMQPAE